MLVSAPDHPTVNPPPDPVRRSWLRCKLGALAAVVLTAFLTVVMSFMIAAPPAAALVQFIAPIAATAVRLAPSTVKAFGAGGTAVVKSPLAGWLGGGLALGFGALFAPGAGPFGMPLPWDVKRDAVTPETEYEANVGQRQRLVTITNYEWTTVAVSAGVFPTLRVETECIPGGGIYGIGCPDPWEGTTQRLVGVEVVAKCLSADGHWWEWTHTARQGLQHSATGFAPCGSVATDGGIPDQVASMEFVNSDGSGTNLLTDSIRVVNPDFDPDAVIGGSDTTIEVEAECHDPASGNTVRVTEVADGLDVLPMVECPDGMTPQRVGWTSTNGDTVKEIGGFETDFTEYPDCADGTCRLRVLVDDVPCAVGRDECYDWMNTEPPARVKCEYGPYAVGLAECRDMERIYRTTPGGTIDPDMPTQPQPAPNPDGTPRPDPTRIVPSDPEGQPVPDLVPDGPPQPDPFPPGTPNPNPDPDPDPPATGVPPPVPVPNPPGNPTDPDTGMQCLRGMASWNPVDWVYTPVKCALQWAFVPETAAAGALATRATDTITDVGLGEWLDVPTAVVSTIPEGGGCRGPALNTPELLGNKTYYPLDACDEPMSRYAQMSRALISVIAVALGGFAAVNGLSVSLTGYRLIERESKSAVTST